jgi:hypothetical protein
VLNWGCAVKCGGRLLCLNENSALACSPWIDETVGFNTFAVLTLSLTGMFVCSYFVGGVISNIQGRFFVGM